MSTERKLASIQRIIDISPIEGADRIEVCRVLGWHCVVGKNEFKVGDLVVFLEVDSVTPVKPEFELLKDSGYRVKTRRFRKQISQGLCLPLSIVSNYSQEEFDKNVPEGYDLTQALQIQKYEPYIAAQLAGQVKGPFPEFFFKTNEDRIQGFPQILEKHQGKLFYVSEKVDGTSFSCFLNNNEFGVCSHNLELKETENNTYWKIARELDLEGRLRKVGMNLGLQGEVLGSGVQGNKYKLSGLQLKLFNVFDIDKRRYLCYPDFAEMVTRLQLEAVPIITANYELPKTVDELVEFSKGRSLLNKDTPREGIVLRPLVEEYEPLLYGRLSFKTINPDFLIKYDSE